MVKKYDEEIEYLRHETPGLYYFSCILFNFFFVDKLNKKLWNKKKCLFHL